MTLLLLGEKKGLPFSRVIVSSGEVKETESFMIKFCSYIDFVYNEWLTSVKKPLKTKNDS